MKTQKRIDERGLACAIWSQQSDGAALQNAGETVKNGSAAELDFEPVELNGWVAHLQFITDSDCAKFHAPPAADIWVNASRLGFKSKSLPVLATSMRSLSPYAQNTLGLASAASC